MAIKNLNLLAKYFTKEKIADIISKTKKPSTPWTDLLFPEDKRIQKASPYISLQDIVDEIGAVPLTRRDGRSVPIDAEKITKMLIEVDPVKPSIFASAKDINDLIASGDVEALDAWMSEKVVKLRNSVSKTIELLTLQALSGKIDYPYATINGVGGSCEVQLGEPKQLKNVKITSSTTFADLENILESSLTEYSSTITATRPVFLMGASVYSNVISIIGAMGSAGATFVERLKKGMMIDTKYEIMLANTAYKLPGKDETHVLVADDEIKIVDLDDAGKLLYASLDSIAANFGAVPFFVDQDETKDPDGLKLIGMSKPFPAIAQNRIGKIKVTVK